MRILLDTHALLWMSASPDRLSETARTALLNDRNQLAFSVAGWWEIAIKIGLGKLELKTEWASILKREMRHNGVEWLSVLPDHCERVSLLSFHHRDPFDRLLIAQAQSEGMAIMTADPQFTPYGVDIVW